MPTPLTKRERRIASAYRQHLKAYERGQFFFSRADRFAMKVAEKLKKEHGATSRLTTDGQGLMLIDNFVKATTDPKVAAGDMPKAWGHGSVRQFELKEIKLHEGS